MRPCGTAGSTRATPSACDGDGFYYFVDRKKDIVRRRGENVSSVEVELVIGEFPGVAEAAIVGVPAAVTDEEIVAVIVAARGDADRRGRDRRVVRRAPRRLQGATVRAHRDRAAEDVDAQGREGAPARRSSSTSPARGGMPRPKPSARRSRAHESGIAREATTTAERRGASLLRRCRERADRPRPVPRVRRSTFCRG